MRTILIWPGLVVDPKNVPRGAFFFASRKIIWRAGLDKKFWRGGASSTSTIILHGPQKRVTELPPNGQVFFSAKRLTNRRARASSSTTTICVGCSAPILQYASELVKSFL